MGKFYDLIKGASHHAWDGLAVRKLAKAMDEVVDLSRLEVGEELDINDFKEETGITIDEFISKVEHGVSIKYEGVILRQTYFNNRVDIFGVMFGNIVGGDIDSGHAAYISYDKIANTIILTYQEV